MNEIGFLVGLGGIPVVLLAVAHNFRRRTPATRSLFWGSLVGWGLGLTAALLCLIAPVEGWDGGLRAGAIYWGAVAGTGLGFAVGFLRKTAAGLHGDGVGEP